MPGFGAVNTFLKVLLLLVAVLVAIRLLPLTLLAGFGLIGAAFGVLAAGLSVVAALVCTALLVAAVLSPLWIPILAVIGIVALCRRRSPAAA
jgi:hypothetical protein